MKSAALKDPIRSTLRGRNVSVLSLGYIDLSHYNFLVEHILSSECPKAASRHPLLRDYCGRNGRKAAYGSGYDGRAEDHRPCCPEKTNPQV